MAAAGEGQGIPDIANEGRLLSIVFKIRRQNANRRQVLENIQPQFNKSKGMLLQLSDPVLVARMEKQIEGFEVIIKDINSEILRQEEVERSLIQDCLSDDLLVVETLDSLKWVAEMRNNRNWRGQVRILRPLLPPGQAGEIFIEGALLICKQNGINVQVIQNYGDL